jgi:hypothetical protein
MPLPLAFIGSKALQTGFSALTSFALGGIKSQDQKDAEYYLSRTTNEIESAMDLNRFAVMTGLIPYDGFLMNYDALWNTLVYVSEQVGQISPDQGRRSLADRDYGGKFEQVWRFQFRDEVIQNYRNDPGCWQNGYRKRECWWTWPERAKFTETAPIAVDLPAPIPADEGGPTTEGELKRQIGSVTGGLDVGTAALWAGGAWVGWKLLKLFV